MNKIPVLVGISTIFFSILTIISIIFPSLFSKLIGSYSQNLEEFEIGLFAIPVILSSIVLIGFGFLYYKNKLPGTIINGINKIRSFEVSEKTTIVILLIIFGVYITLSTPELSSDESIEWLDYRILDQALKIWPFGESENVYVQEQNDRYVRMFLLDASLKIFNNIKILPFIASIFVILFTYLLTAQITHKRFPGIIAILVLLQSNTFLTYDTVAVYENFWVLFYLISIYAIQKRWVLSPIFYGLSFFTKAFVAPNFIMTLYYVWQSQISKKKKLALLVSYAIVVSTLIAIIFSGETIYPDVVNVDFSKFFIGISSFAPLLRYDIFLILTLLPVVVGLTFMAKKSISHSDSILFLILGTFLAGPILISFTNFYEILPYRFVPMIVFFAIGIGLFFQKKEN